VLNKSNIMSYSKQNGLYAYSCRCFIVSLRHASPTHEGTLRENDEYPDGIEGNLIFI